MAEAAQAGGGGAGSAGSCHTDMLSLHYTRMSEFHGSPAKALCVICDTEQLNNSDPFVFVYSRAKRSYACVCVVGSVTRARAHAV